MALTCFMVPPPFRLGDWIVVSLRSLRRPAWVSTLPEPQTSQTDQRLPPMNAGCRERPHEGNLQVLGGNLCSVLPCSGSACLRTDGASPASLRTDGASPATRGAEVLLCPRWLVQSRKGSATWG